MIQKAAYFWLDKSDKYASLKVAQTKCFFLICFLGRCAAASGRSHSQNQIGEAHLPNPLLHLSFYVRFFTHFRGQEGIFTIFLLENYCYYKNRNLQVALTKISTDIDIVSLFFLQILGFRTDLGNPKLETLVQNLSQGSRKALMKAA